MALPALHLCPAVLVDAVSLRLLPQLHEEDELVWNDGVAPETCIDFDAPHINSYEALAWWFGGIMMVYLTYKTFGLFDKHSWKKTVRALAGWRCSCGPWACMPPPRPAPLAGTP